MPYVYSMKGEEEKKISVIHPCGCWLSWLVFLIHPFSFTDKFSTNSKTLSIVSCQIHDCSYRRVLAKENVNVGL